MIRVAVIGAGHWGPNLIRNFHNGHASEVVWIVDQDAARLAEVQTRFPDVRVTQESARAFSDPAVDAVVIATPTITHFTLAQAALQRGKHVLVEKPLATDSWQATELLQTAASHQLILMVGHVFLYNSAIRKVKEYLGAAHLGRVYYVSMVRTNLGPTRLDVNAAWDLAAHDLSIVNYWLDAGPLSVSAIGGTWINDDIEDAIFATLKYPQDVLVNLHASWLNARKARDITVPKVTVGEPLAAQCAHFLECIVMGKQPFTGAREGIAVVRALEAMQRSIRARGCEQDVEVSC